jgi:hypothetical protein
MLMGGELYKEDWHILENLMSNENNEEIMKEGKKFTN